MGLPIFYIDDITPSADTAFIQLGEESSRHIVQVLRMQVGEELQLTDGKGFLYLASIVDDHKKKCSVKIISEVFREKKNNPVRIAISPLKNAARFEWFLEKAVEIGVEEIIPIICQRTEKQHLRTDRLKSIVVSAMLQSQQTWLPVLQEPVKFETYIKGLPAEANTQRYIAHCEADDQKKPLANMAEQSKSLILIGPEGDFSNPEIELATTHGFIPVSLGETRLRTETAGMVAAVLLNR
ncbi:MAG TPA: RsmE family RNA methyltransferase [Ferruginibacter sp.]|nr:RsmE family RNA methyltransferase [Ferruginibacter sp.]